VLEDEIKKVKELIAYFVVTESEINQKLSDMRKIVIVIFLC